VTVCATAPKPLRVSWSRIKNWEACGMRSKLMTEGKQSKVIDGRAFLPGTLADNAMRAWLNNGLLTGKWEPGGMEDYLEGLWDDYTSPSAQYSIQWRGNPNDDKRAVLKKVQTALRRIEPILFEKVVPYPYQPEYRFTATMGIKDLQGQTVHVEVYGAVDVAVNYGEDGYGLFDLKVTESQAYIDTTLAQLIFYALAFRGWTGVWPSQYAFWVPLMEQSVVNLVPTPEDIRYMQSRIVAYCQGVWAQDWTLTADESNCWNCPTKHACPRWRNPIQQDDQGRNRLSFDRPKFAVESVEPVEPAPDPAEVSSAE
jgi:hypothetical protein